LTRPNVIVKIDESKPIRNGPTTVMTSRTCTITDFDLYLGDFDEINEDLRDRFVKAYAEVNDTFTTSIVTSNYMASSGEALLVDSSSGQITITLPIASDNTNSEIYIKKTSSDDNYVVVTASELIDDKTSVSLKQQYTAIGFLSNGVTWDIIGTVLCYPTP